MAGRLEMLILLGMPDLTGDPTRDVRFEPQYSDVRGRTREDPITATEVRIESFIRDVVCRNLGEFRIPYRVQRKTAEFVAQMTPGIQVPVSPVVHQALW